MFNASYFSYLSSHPWQLIGVSLAGLAFCFVLLGVLHFVPRQGKRYVIIGLTFVAGLVYALEYFWPPAAPPSPDAGKAIIPLFGLRIPLSDYTDVIGNVLQVVAGFTFLLGIYNLVHIHANNVRRRRTNWGFSVVFFAFFAAMVVASFWRDSWQWFGPVPTADLSTHSIRAPERLVVELRNPATPLSTYLAQHLSPGTQALLPLYNSRDAVRAELEKISRPGNAPAVGGQHFTLQDVDVWMPDKGLKEAWRSGKPLDDAMLGAAQQGVDEKTLGQVVADINKALAGPSLLEAARASSVRLSPEAEALSAGSPTGPELLRLNRYLVEDAYPGLLAANLRMKDLPPAFILDRDTLDPDQREQLGLPRDPPAEFNPRFANDFYTYLFQGLYLNLEATMFSILAFYIISAAYRAFRIRSAEAALMMITAVILMAGQVPLGMALTNWIPNSGAASFFRIENFSYWVLSVLNMPVQRAIDFGLGLGALAMSLRIWLSLERGTYFGQEV